MLSTATDGKEILLTTTGGEEIFSTTTAGGEKLSTNNRCTMTNAATDGEEMLQQQVKNRW